MTLPLGVLGVPTGRLAKSPLYAQPAGGFASGLP